MNTAAVPKSEPTSYGLEHLFENEALTDRRPSRILYLLYKDHWIKLFWSAFFFLIKHSPVYVLPIITANLINMATKPDRYSTSSLWWNIGILFVVIVQNVPTQVLHISYMSKAIRYVEASLRSTLVRKLQRLSMSAHGELAAGRLQSKVLRDVEAIEFLSRQMMLSVLPAIVSIVVAVVITAGKSWTVMLFFVLTIPAGVAMVTFFRKKIQRTNSDFRKQIESMSGQVSEMVGMMPVTRAHGLQETEINKIDSTLSKLRSKGYRLDIVEAYFGSAAWVTFQTFQVLCLAFTVLLAFRGEIQVGDIVLYQSYFAMILGAITQLINIYPNIAKGFESIYSVTEILLSQDTEEYRGHRKLEEVRGEFDFRNVNFGYPGSDRHVLNGFNLQVKAGECIALVGASGAGKSTVLNLAIGFSRPTFGEVAIDGVPMDELDMTSYRSRIAVVHQSTVLFSGTIRENITYGLPSVSEERLEEVIRMTYLQDVIAQLPQGLDTAVGEHGGKLSGGQRQRIAIARALVRDPKIILLDEATSALDNESEYFVQQAMQKLIQNRTTFIVAHRLSTIRDADRIVVMKRGQVAEIGTYDELMAKGGEFYQLKQLQA
ncbi:ABC transporter ATP-binding protein/permease [Cohnella ginsengisoli]|uniref:ABC transporter ATP-binding protein/permease n=1 Tax=Cohnella ginsengisoli TaxID=425004 RepID=A0A9X4KEG9_9BACL|nr:ABC transporter ATP-binding protein [Cohnella ginsengisoli]MDG0790465.1 ABC transporter ATP-binding protein/permease [Cohnella ginsengisoli]